jgi:hypothetical protein
MRIPFSSACRSIFHRRHLTVSQRAAVAAELANLTDGQRADYAGASNEAAVTQKAAGELLGVSRSAVQRAEVVRAADPELHAKVKAGEVSLENAKRTVQSASPDNDDITNGSPKLYRSSLTNKLSDEDEWITQFKSSIRYLSRESKTPAARVRAYIREYLKLHL